MEQELEQQYFGREDGSIDYEKMDEAYDAQQKYLEECETNPLMSDHAGVKYLKSVGLSEKRGVIFVPKERELSCYECEVINYLCDEWDYGVETV